MRTAMRVTLLMATATLLGCASGQAIPGGVAAGDVALVSRNALELKDGMRRLWSDHVIFTREFIIAAANDDPGTSAALARLMKNQEDIGDAIVPYYGSPAGARLTSLLKEHISIAGELVTAAKAGHSANVAAADARWRVNADQIATFLANANPNWTRATLLHMLNEHLDLTTAEATARLQKRYTDDVNIFDKIHGQALAMADALTDGIVRQFASRF